MNPILIDGKHGAKAYLDGTRFVVGIDSSCDIRIPEEILTGEPFPRIELLLRENRWAVVNRGKGSVTVSGMPLARGYGILLQDGAEIRLSRSLILLFSEQDYAMITELLPGSPTRKYCILKAVEYNWSMPGPGQWDKKTWSIFSDRSYSCLKKLVSFGMPSDAGKGSADPNIKTVTGQMSEDAFKRLQELITLSPWRDPAKEVRACDGVGWEIEAFSPSGEIIRTSGRASHIYGQSILEEITSLLPPSETVYNYSAFQSWNS